MISVYDGRLARTAERTELALRISLDGLGGADFGDVGAVSSFSKAVCSAKKEFKQVGPLPISDESPISTRASRLDSWFGFSRRSAL